MHLTRNSALTAFAADMRASIELAVFHSAYAQTVGRYRGLTGIA